MTTIRTRNSHLGRLCSRLLLSVAALVAALVVFAPAASADYGLEPGTTFVKGHETVTPEICSVFLPPGPGCTIFGITIPGGGQGTFWAPGYELFVDGLAAAPEVTQAGGHPDFTTAFQIQDYANDPDGQTKDIFTDLPAGSVGYPQAVPRCESADLNLTLLGNCPTEAQVGFAATGSFVAFFSPVSSMVPVPGEPAAFGYKVFGYTINLFTRPRSESDYGLTVEARDLPTGVALRGTALTLWGVPYDTAHDNHRFDSDGSHGGTPLGATVTGAAMRPLTSAPTNCNTGPLSTTVRIRSWGKPDQWISADAAASEQTGCEAIDFKPQVTASPTTTVADSPTGLNFDVNVPQNTECEAGPPIVCPPSTSHLKDTKVTLPEGMVINPSGANGLDGCSPAEIGLTTPLGSKPIHFSDEPANCPDGSKIGTAEVETPLTESPLPGSVYIADPYDNPFKSLLAIYIGVDDPKRGIIVKFVGEVVPDPVTGQLVITFTDAPQLPFEHLRLSFRQGPHAALRTPTCGDYSTTASLTPYAAPDSPVATKSDWSITQGPGGSCEVPNAPSFDAGTVTPIAGAESPFVMHLRREDGSQNFSAITLDPPPGLMAKLAGTEICSGAALKAARGKSGADEKASPSCPANSRVGSVVAGAGAGPSPYYVPGTVYLAGPYKGAPLSLAIIAPAIAGPFDLGTIVVQVAAYIDPRTARITAVTDPLPRILDGIPLDIRTVDLSLDRPEFTRNPTSCDPMAVKGLLTSTLGQTASLESRFQVAECGQLGFKPKVFLRLFGKRFGRGANPRLRAVIVPRGGDANISRIAVKMPRSLLVDQSHIRTVCTRVQFAADACPAGAIYGHVVARSPLVDYPLTGNVYLRSSDNTLPDLVADLRGPDYQPVRIEAVGRIDSVKGALRNTFDIVPDIPISKIVLLLRGGKKSLLVASRNLCKGIQRARINLSGHNGRQRLVQQKITIRRCDRKRRAAAKRNRRARVAHGSAAG